MDYIISQVMNNITALAAFSKTREQLATGIGKGALAVAIFVLPLIDVGCPIRVGAGALTVVVAVLEGAGVRGSISLGIGALAISLAVLALSGVRITFGVCLNASAAGNIVSELTNEGGAISVFH